MHRPSTTPPISALVERLWGPYPTSSQLAHARGLIGWVGMVSGACVRHRIVAVVVATRTRSMVDRVDQCVVCAEP